MSASAIALSLATASGEPWLRQIEQQVFAMPPDVAARYSERVQQQLGYSIHSTFMGYVDGVHPRRLIERTRRREPGAATPTAQTPRSLVQNGDEIGVRYYPPVRHMGGHP